MHDKPCKPYQMTAEEAVEEVLSHLPVEEEQEIARTPMTGQLTYTVDQNGMVQVPPVFGLGFLKGGYFVPGWGRYVVVYPKTWFDAIAARLPEPSLTEEHNRRVAVALKSNVSEFTLDRDAGIRIPPGLRQHAEITDSVVFVGLYRYAEIWNPELFNGQFNLVDDSIKLEEYLVRDEPKRHG